MERHRTLAQIFREFATNHVVEPDVPAASNGAGGYAKSTKVALLLIKEEINKPLRKLEVYLNEMPGILNVFGFEESPDYSSFSIWDVDLRARVAPPVPPFSGAGGTLWNYVD